MPDPKKNTEKKANFLGYVPYNVDTPIKDAVKKSDMSLKDALEHVARLADDGCKVSVSYEDSRGCYFVQAFQQQPKHVNAGLILSTRHSDLETALKLLIVLHEDVFAEVWVNPEKGSSQYDW